MAEQSLFPWYGVIEGFYGRPWSSHQRKRLFRWMHKTALNTYMYGPKDDLKHRVLWREPYDEGEATEIGVLIRDCQRHGLNFIYAIGPGLDMMFAETSELDALLNKVRQVASLGAQNFALLFDDIPGQLTKRDKAVFQTPAAAQCFVANELRKALKRDFAESEILFCPTQYCGRMAVNNVSSSAYLQEVGTKLHAGIHIFWTGPEIISENLPVESLRELQTVLKRKPVIWDNLLANDYDMRRLYLGPYSGRSNDVLQEVEGILLNPNCQFEANFIAVETFARFAKGDTCSPRQAYFRALMEWLPEYETGHAPAITARDIELFSDLYYLPTEFGERGHQYIDDLARLLQNPLASDDDTVSRFEATCEQIIALYDKLSGLRNSDLWYALCLHAWEAKEIALLLRAWMRWRREHTESDAGFSSPEFRKQIFRGGFGAVVERLLPMDDHGKFRSGVNS